MTDTSPAIPEEWIQAEEAAKAHVQLLNESAFRAWETVAVTVDSGVLEPLRVIVKQALTAHEDLLNALEDGTNWRRAVAYRGSVASDVLSPIHSELSRQNRGKALGTRILQVFETLEPLVAAAPPDITLPLPPTVTVRTNKNLSAPSGRTVALGVLCRQHVEVRLGRLLAERHRQLQEHAACLAGRLELAFTEWTHAFLAEEQQMNKPDFHRPSLVQEIWGVAVSDDGGGDLLSHAQKLQTALVATLAECTVPAFEMQNKLQEAASALEQDLAHAGVYRSRNKISWRSGDQPVAQVQTLMERRTTWHGEVVDRLAMNGHLMMFRHTWVEIGDAFLHDVAETILRPVWQTFGAAITKLEETEALVEALCHDAETSQSTEHLPKSLKALQVQTLETLREDLATIPGFLSVGDAGWEVLQTRLRTLPEELFLHSPAHEGGRSWTLKMQQIVRENLQPFAELLAEPADAFWKESLRVWRASEQVLHVVKFNTDAALDILSSRGGELEAIGDVRELATGGLRRAADNLTSFGDSLKTPWKSFAVNVFQLLHDEWVALHRSLQAEAFLEEQWVSLQLHLRRTLQRLPRHAKAYWERYVQAGWRLVRYGRSRARTLIEQGRSAIGVAETSGEKLLSSVDALSPAGIKALQQEFPLVYRKLFSFGSLREASLLKGRDADMQRIDRHFRRWRTGYAAGALVLPMPQGSGRTSLLNAVATALAKEASVHKIALNERLSSTDVFAEKIAEKLGLRASSLERLEAELLAIPRVEPARVCLIDNLEHLLIRSAGGSAFLERILVFFSRTDSRVCWISTMGDVAWRYLERTRHTAVGLVTAWQPALPSRSMLTDIILSRHRCSGMSLRFVDYETLLSPLAKRRLGRARTPEARHELLQELYFQRIFQHSGTNIMLALFYWLRCARFEAEDNLLALRPVEPLGFRFFASFDMARAFTMSAFLFHKSLTIAEHNRIFQMADADSIYLLESLLNLRLLVASSSLEEGHTRIKADGRYSLHPMILHPTMLLLRERNILY